MDKPKTHNIDDPAAAVDAPTWESHLPAHDKEGSGTHGDGRLREIASRAGDRLESVGWIEVAAGAAIGLGIGYLLGSRRSNETLAEIFSGSIRPWASRHVHDAVEPMRSSRPVCGLASMVNRMRNS